MKINLSFLKHPNLFRYIEYSVVVIVVIVWIIVGLLSYSNSKKEVRDTVRVYHMNEISNTLDNYYSVNTTYPLPESFLEIKYWAETVLNQGQYWKSVSDMLWAFEMLDPKESSKKYFNNYVYSVNKNKTEYQIMTFLEKQTETTNLISDGKRYPFSKWKNIGIFLSKEKNIPLQSVVSALDISELNKNYNVVFWDNTLLTLTPENRDIFSAFTKQTIYTSCSNLLELSPQVTSGYYYVNPNKRKAIKVYCDMVSDGGWWTRLYYKSWAETCFNDENKYTTDMITKLFTKDFAVSDKLTTLTSEGSWILNDVDFKNKDFDFSKFAKVTNCKGPDGTEWSTEYWNNYKYENKVADKTWSIEISWDLETLWTWNEMFYWCTSTKKTWEKVVFRIWGFELTKWLFIHWACHNYSLDNNSITSLWNWDNIRVMWVR